MKIVIVGASGTIGSAVVKALSEHEIVKVGHTHGDFTADITNKKSITQLFTQIGKFDALVVTTGNVAFNTLTQMTDEQWEMGLRSKLMGQINLARVALSYLNQSGSITLTSGILSEEMIAGGVSASVINGAIEHFVRSAPAELPHGIRINVVSPTMLAESASKYAAYFPGFIPVKAATVAQAYYKSVLGIQTGQVYKVYS